MMYCKAVTDQSTVRKFLEVPRMLYRNDPNWICPLDDDIRAVFDPQRNNFFQHGVCNRWILEDETGNPIGRIAAFVNNEKAGKNPQPTGGTGFFECPNDHDAARLLFDTARDWLRAQGMEAMDGPVNFGENDKYWGLLVEGFKPPSLGMNYNPPYYRELFESYGFKKLYDQYTNFLDAREPLPERFTKIADWVMQKPEYSFRHFSKAKLEKFIADFCEIYNDAWSDFENFTPIVPATIRESFRQMRPVMDEKIIWFAYHREEPIAFVVCLPDVNQLLRHVNGTLNLWGKLKFFWYKHVRKPDRLRIIVMGCKKRFQNHGIESALIRCLQKEVLPRGTITGVELAWVGDFNEKMLAIHAATGAKKDKVHRTYRYLFGS
ncbi:GNAT family N-acetyltransferase [Compostibacter hankyongensis]|uniref:N-acetyltransferase n=1 Tax=Compostibacter hankyongensis TaxID=1007089 RepID=A0ABP8FDH2_9BACT